MGRMRTTTTAVALVVRRIVREVVADQVREGRLHTRSLPRGVRVMSRLGMALFWLVAFLALASSLLGLRHDKELASGLVDLLLSVCLGLLNVCAQSMARGWRIAGLLLSATSMIPQMILLAIMVGTGGLTIISLLGWIGIAALGGSLAVLTVFIVMRPGLQPWRLWLAGAVGGLGHLTAMVIAWGFPFARSVNELSMMITDVALLFVAVPLAAASGISFAQVATDTATWTVLSVRELLSPAAWVVVTALSCLGALTVAVLLGPGRWAVVATLAHTLASVGLCALGLRLVGRPVDLPRPTALTADLSARGMAFGALMCSWLLVLPLTVIPGAPLAHMPMGIIGTLVTAVALSVMWLRAIRRRRAVMVVLAPPIFCACIYSAAQQLLRYLGVGTLPGLRGSLTGAVLVVLALCQAAIWARAGQFSPDRDRGRWAIVTMVAVEALIFPQRESVAQPLEAIAQGSAVAVLLAGLVWRVLTEAEYTHRDSPRFPAPARALFFVSQALLAAVFVLQSVVLPDAMAGVLDLNMWASVVDSVVGQGVQIGVAMGLLALGRWRVDPMDPADAVEEASIAAMRRQRRRRLSRPASPAGP
ncbi:hypothetical protein [Acidipropionibacterium virtanenii]|uniref:Uncharacterized protein n=1 Tax=Acidipropionibacterium virtanenii TaxID=2057246 RepID=A0A344UU43_9ACTN|nr:hypothetical protein [Acidipropionibacterium virtanenii]AXE38791.1 hypothetical protein JS278_01627 [Acidipropionibacterium virtanenii]